MKYIIYLYIYIYNVHVYFNCVTNERHNNTSGIILMQNLQNLENNVRSNTKSKTYQNRTYNL